MIAVSQLGRGAVGIHGPQILDIVEGLEHIFPTHVDDPPVVQHAGKPLTLLGLGDRLHVRTVDLHREHRKHNRPVAALHEPIAARRGEADSPIGQITGLGIFAWPAG